MSVLSACPLEVCPLSECPLLEVHHTVEPSSIGIFFIHI